MTPRNRRDKQGMSLETARKIEAVKKSLGRQKSVLTAFSGGVDSSLLLALAHEVLGGRAFAGTVASPLLPEKEKRLAKDFTAKRGIKHYLVDAGEMKDPRFIANTPDRCYICKAMHLRALLDKAQEHGIARVVHGVNTDDYSDYRPGLKAAAELPVLAPLAEAGLCKEEIREAARALGLDQWSKPSMACLASRIPYGTPLTPGNLGMVERAEDFLQELGIGQCRVRSHGDLARIEVEESDFHKLGDALLRQKIIIEFQKIGFAYTSLDLGGYVTGNMNRGVLDAG